VTTSVDESTGSSKFNVNVAKSISSANWTNLGEVLSCVSVETLNVNALTGFGTSAISTTPPAPIESTGVPVMLRKSLIECRSGVEKNILMTGSFTADELVLPVKVKEDTGLTTLSCSVIFETINDDARIVSSNVRERNPSFRFKSKLRRLGLTLSETNPANCTWMAFAMGLSVMALRFISRAKELGNDKKHDDDVVANGNKYFIEFISTVLTLKLITRALSWFKTSEDDRNVKVNAGAEVAST